MDTDHKSARITQRDVARNLGLTQATVSLALRNNTRIPVERRKEIREAAEAMGYQPSPAASALAELRHTSTAKPRRASVAWLNFWRESTALRGLEEFDLYFQGASDAAKKFGFHLEEFRCGEEMSLKRIESILLARGIEGIFLPHIGGILICVNSTGTDSRSSSSAAPCRPPSPRSSPPTTSTTVSWPSAKSVPKAIDASGLSIQV